MPLQFFGHNLMPSPACFASLMLDNTKISVCFRVTRPTCSKPCNPHNFIPNLTKQNLLTPTLLHDTVPYNCETVWVCKVQYSTGFGRLLWLLCCVVMWAMHILLFCVVYYLTKVTTPYRLCDTLLTELASVLGNFGPCLFSKV